VYLLNRGNKQHLPAPYSTQECPFVPRPGSHRNVLQRVIPHAFRRPSLTAVNQREGHIPAATIAKKLKRPDSTNMSFALLQPTIGPLRTGPVKLRPAAADRRILIVDDEYSVREVFSAYLSENYECTTAASSEEALGHLALRNYALVISDLTMPGRNGIELLREVVARFPETVVVMVSAVDRPQRVRDALRLGAFDYLIKPCEMESLSISVERALERRELERTAKRYKDDLERRNAELAGRTAELERLQAQIVHSEKMASLGQLAAGVAHELNNPAGFIYGNMDILKNYVSGLSSLLTVYDTAPLPQLMADQVTQIKGEIDYHRMMAELDSIISDCMEGAERIRGVVQNLRLFSRLDEAEVKKIDLHEGIDSTVRLLSRYYSSGHVNLIREYAVLPEVSCYAGQLNQVWMNLLINAAQAVGAAGEVKVTTSYEADTVVVVISDNGIGIATEQLSKIFDPFFTTKPVGEGTGLGLSISYGIIERHQGTITVASRLGEGTSFTVRIPVYAESLAENRGQKKETSPNMETST
jgi:two-component system, NtrC family, sensor kinase